MRNKVLAYYSWIILAAAFGTRLIATGIQNSLGVYIQPMHLQFGWDIASIALASSISLVVYALTQPIFGRLTDMWGAKPVLLIGALLLGIGQALVFTVNSPWQLYVYFGIAVGAGSGAVTLPFIVLVTDWFKKRRGLAVSIASSAIGAGFPTITLFAVYVTYYASWRFANLVVGLVALVVIVPIVLFVAKERPPEAEQEEQHISVTYTSFDSENRGTSVRSMFADRSFWLVALPYGVCGFTVSLVSVHLVSLAIDDDVPQLAAGGALGVLGIFMTVGLLFAGMFADRIKKKNILILSYGIRGAAFLLILGTPNEFAIYAFAAVFGFVELATIPATTLIFRDLYGGRSMGLAFGFLMFSHQMGGAVSSYLGGVVFDVTGSYNLIVMVSIALSLLAALASVWIREKVRSSPPVNRKVVYSE